MATFRAAEDIEPIILRFGAGLNTQMTDTIINEMECSDGANFRLDLGDVELHPRRPFDLRGTCPGAGSIDGFAQLRKRDGTLSTLIQRGTAVYTWDGTPGGFTDTGFTVAAGTRMRGKPREHAWLLDDRVLISDLGLQMDVMQWDGTTISTISFKKSDNSAFGTMRAKYVYVTGERAHYGNVLTSTATPHMLVGSKLQEYDVVADTGTATDAADPFFVLTPDLKPINGALGSFGLTLISSDNGSIFNIGGSDATDFAMQDLHPLSAVRGEEAIVYVGNDVAYGLQGRIEMLRQGEQVAKYVGDNLGFHIDSQHASQLTIADVNEWTIIYNRRRQIGYFFPKGQSICWAFSRKIRNFDPSLSPWMPMTTLHPVAFQPSCTWAMFDPQTGLEEVYMGDGDGNIYQLEGTGAGDGGTEDIRVERTSRVFTVGPKADAYDIEGWIYYRKQLIPSEIRIEIQWSGESVYDLSKTVTLPARSGGAFYGGAHYYGEGSPATYYGVSFGGRISRQPLDLPGQGSDFQIKVSSEGTAPFIVEKIILRARAAG